MLFLNNTVPGIFLEFKILNYVTSFHIYFLKTIIPYMLLLILNKYIVFKFVLLRFLLY